MVHGLLHLRNIALFKDTPHISAYGSKILAQATTLHFGRRGRFARPVKTAPQIDEATPEAMQGYSEILSHIVLSLAAHYTKPMRRMASMDCNKIAPQTQRAAHIVRRPVLLPSPVEGFAAKLTRRPQAQCP